MRISFHDFVLEPENKHVKKKDIKIKVSLGSKTLDTLSLLDAMKEVIVPLSNKLSEDKVIIVCTSATPLYDGGFQIGSVSIPQQIIYNGSVGTYTQWITLFEHEDDDEYDGEMGINDDEDPRIKVRFITEPEFSLGSDSSNKTKPSELMKKDSPQIKN